MNIVGEAKKRKASRERSIARTKRNRRNRPEPKFELVVKYIGFDRAADIAIKSFVGKDSDGSGMFMTTGERDLSFYFDSKEAAEAARDRVKAYMKVRVQIVDLERRARRQASSAPVYVGKWIRPVARKKAKEA